MNYEANTNHWVKGHIVIHDADAKEPRMLMRVIGYTRDGLCKTQYCSRWLRRTVWKNEIKFLHDPARFGINPDIGLRDQEGIERAQQNWSAVFWWNKTYEPGVAIMTTSADGGFVTRTTGKAYFNSSGEAMIHLERGGNWTLEFCAFVPESKLELMKSLQFV